MEKDNLWTDQGGYGKHTEHVMQTKGDRDHRSGMMQGPCPYADQDTTQIQFVTDHGIPEREKFAHDT